MSRRAMWTLAALAVLGIAAVVWWSQPQGPRQVGPGEPLPLGEPVEREFVDETTGEREVWKLEKRTTTRDEVLRALPQPDPGAAERVPDESARALDAMALEAWKHGEIESALTRFEQAIASDPDDRLPRSHYGQLLTLMADYGRARPHLERAAELAPEEPQVWLDLLTLYERTQQLDLAWAARERVQALSGGRPIVQGARGEYRLEGEPALP